MPTTARFLQVNQIAIDQADYFASDGYTRITGITVADLTNQMFFNNAQQPWALVNGLGVSDTQVVSGRVYFHEVPGSPGIYSVRFRPNAVGYWRLVLNYPAGLQVLAQEYDVSAQAQVATSGVKSSFTRPC
jgi:hypothetical protein